MMIFEPSPTGEPDWQRNWAAIDEFIREWFQVDYKRTIDTAHIRELEQAVGVALPPSAAEWCAFASAAYQLGRRFSFRDCLVAERMKDHDAVSLLMQGEEDLYWAVESHHLNSPDPPVRTYSLDHDDSEGRFLDEGLWAPTVSSFALDYLLMYSYSAGGGFTARTWPNPGRFPGQSLPNSSRDSIIADFGPPAKFGHLELFHSDGILVVLSLLPSNWQHEQVKVELRQPKPFKGMPNSVREIYRHKNVIHGGLSEAWGRSQ